MRAFVQYQCYSRSLVIVKKIDAWWSGVDVWWPLDMTRGYDIGLQIWRWRVQSPAVLRSRRDPRQVVHLPRSIRHAVYIGMRAKGDSLKLVMKVTAVLAENNDCLFC